MTVIKKIINNTDDLVSETVEGYIKAYKDKLIKLDNRNVVARKNKSVNKVGVIIGNGSGHEPACLGFIGKNMLDCNAFGGIFAAPGPYDILEAIKEAETGKGVCVLISNHAGDILNSKMAIDMAEDDGYNAKAVILYDDIASAPKTELEERRGAVGTIFSYKMVGSYAEEGHDLDEVINLAEKIRDNVRSLSVGVISGTSPVTGEKMFDLPEGEVEIGLGIHGEASAHRMKSANASEIAKVMVQKLIDDKPYKSGDEVAVIVNGMGQTTMMEMMIFYNEVEDLLAKANINVFKPLIGNYITTQEMGGIGLAFCKMDDELKNLWTKETDAPQFPSL